MLISIAYRKKKKKKKTKTSNNNIKTQRMRSRELRGWNTHGNVWRGTHLEWAGELYKASLILALCIASIWLFLSCILV